ncbi:MAG: NADH-quinone oxidoreductase subunit B family protein [Acidimicrobiales bacterium]
MRISDFSRPRIGWQRQQRAAGAVQGEVRAAGAVQGEVQGAVRAAADRNRGSLQLRHVDAGSCNGCELEIASIFSPAYDAEKFGIRLEASPRHADGLLVTGPVTANMSGPLRKTFDAVPRPRIVIALGDCARDCGVFKGAYGVEGAVGDVVPVDLEIPGCPPHPAAIVAALRTVAGT